MAEKNWFNREFLREEYLRLRDKFGFKDNLSVAQAYVKKYPIDTRHTKGWYEDKPSRKFQEDDYVYRALGIRENKESQDSEFYLIDKEFDNKEDATNASIQSAKNNGCKGITEPLADVMVLSLYKHRIYRGGNSMKKDTIQDVTDGIETALYSQKFSKEICAELDALENLHENNQLIAKGYVDIREYSDESKELRKNIIERYIRELNIDPFDVDKNDIATFERIDHRNNRKKPKIKESIQSSTIEMSICVAVIDYLAGLNVGIDSAAEVLSDSHKWRMEHNLAEKGSLRRFDTAIIGNTNQSLKKMIWSMIKYQFDIQPLFSENGRCIGCLELKSLSRHMGVHGYSRIGDEIDIKKLDDLKLIAPPPPEINAINKLHWFSRLLGDRLDALLFHWEPETNPLHQKIKSKSNPQLEPGLHIITSHDVLAYVEWNNSKSTE